MFPQKTFVVDYTDALRLASDVLKCASTPAIERAIFHVFFGAARTHTTMLMTQAGAAKDTVSLLSPCRRNACVVAFVCGVLILCVGRQLPVPAAACFVAGPAPNDVQVAVPITTGPINPVEDLW